MTLVSDYDAAPVGVFIVGRQWNGEAVSSARAMQMRVRTILAIGCDCASARRLDVTKYGQPTHNALRFSERLAIRRFVRSVRLSPQLACGSLPVGMFAAVSRMHQRRAAGSVSENDYGRDHPRGRAPSSNRTTHCRTLIGVVCDRSRRLDTLIETILPRICEAAQSRLHRVDCRRGR